MALVLIRVRNQPARERYRTGLSREQMCLWFAGYPKRRAAMSGLGRHELFPPLSTERPVEVESGHCDRGVRYRGET